VEDNSYYSEHRSVTKNSWRGSSSGLNCTAWILVMNYDLSVYHKYIIFAKNKVDCTRKLYYKSLWARVEIFLCSQSSDLATGEYPKDETWSSPLCLLVSSAPSPRFVSTVQYSHTYSI
jgi:hypothetical protein